ncbi:MAG: hypothetical protein JST89_16525 [Cyanobacteria bacterium SZAS-4]|nr:hypothetical protein [Cyanobacteria bacterium SZAS-4]
MATADQITSIDRAGSVPLVHTDRSIVGDFARTLAYTAIQNPVTAVSQILDKATGTNVAANINMIDRADQGSFGGGRWHAQQIAAGVGALVPFVAALAVTKNISRAVQAEELALRYSSGAAAATASAFRTGEMATAGLVQGALLEPNQNKDKFFQERLTQGITSGVTMGSMHMFSNKFSEWTGASAIGASLLNKSLTTGLAGGAGGFVGLEAHGLLTGEALSGKEAVQSVYQAVFTGAALGALGSAQARLHQPKSGLTSIENYLARNEDPTVYSSDYFAQQKEKSSGWRTPWSGDEFRPLSPFERVEAASALHRDADPLLRKQETIKDFVERVRAVRSQAFEVADQKDDRVLSRISRLQKSLDARPVEGESKQDVRDYAAIKRLEKKAVKLSGETGEELQAAREDYTIRLNAAINDFLTQHHLPNVDLVLGDRLKNGSAASYDNARITVRNQYAGPRELEGDLIDAVYGKVSDFRQDVLRINVLADKLRLPPQPNDVQIQIVKDEFSRIRRQEKEISDKLVEDVLRLRKDHPLSAEDKLYAEKMPVAPPIGTLAQLAYNMTDTSVQH